MLKDKITKEQYETFMEKLDWEGTDYALAEYSTWKDIKDKKFHVLRDAYVKARRELFTYIQVDEW